jgi:tetratricopeptide (TPR) repeat protein
MRSCFVALGTFVVAAAMLDQAAQGQQMIDRVHRRNGIDSGQILEVNPLGVKLSKNGVESNIAGEDIEFIFFAGEPDTLNSARTALAAGRVADAARILESVTADSGDRSEVKAEVAFYKLLVQGRLALAGHGEVAPAIAAARAFLTGEKSSFHLPQAIQLLGDLLAANGDFAAARTEYARLANAKTPYYITLSALLVGQAWQGEGEYAKAVEQFDAVLASRERGPLVDPLKTTAQLDRAVSQAAAGAGDDAAAAIAEVIAKTDAEDAASLARAYNALGDCYLKAGDKQGALFAFLHVDLLYDDAPDAHAKALHELVALWRADGHDTRAQEAAAELADKYPNSRWAKAN